jgi:hypothetical protein
MKNPFTKRLAVRYWVAERYALRRDILPMAKRYAPNGAWKTKTFYFL